MPITGDPPGDPSRLFGLERQRLLDLLLSLHHEDWARDTPCPGWSVLGLVCHLVGNDLGILSGQRDGHFGTCSPDGADETQFIEWIDELMQKWVSAARGLSPQVTVDLLAWSGPQLVQLFAGQDLTARTAHVQWAGTELVPVWLNQVRELSEFWIHRQQLLDSLGREPDLRPDLLGPVLDGMRWAYPFRMAGHSRRPGDTVTIEISGSAATTWHLVASDQRWEFASVPGNRVANITMSSDEAWRLLSNNLPRVRQSTLTTSGDGQLLEVVRNTRAIIGEPK